MLTPTEASDIKTPDPGRALKMGVGLASPLWPAFIATAGAGVAFWWMSRWIQGEPRSFAPADGAFPLGRPPEPAETEQQPSAQPVDAAMDAAKSGQAEAARMTEDLAVQGAAATEAVLDQTSEAAEAVAEQSVAIADTMTAAGQAAAEQAVDAGSDIAAAAPRPPRSRRERPVE